ncbi:MAG: hypothetical protein NTZ71_18055 [Planctomycetota bacterium]|nr:hypothetical protein [Planctomycetota bacterium]
MFKSLSRLFNMSKVPASTRAIAHRLRPGLQMLEDRTTPAVTYDLSGGGVLTINLQAANDAPVIEYNPASTGTYTITPKITSSSQITLPVTSIVVRDTGTKAIGQSVTIRAASGTSIGALSGGFTSTGVETVTVNAAIGDSTNTGGISISAATAINVNANLTAGGAPITLSGSVVLNANVTIDAGNADITFGGTIISSSSTARVLIVDAGTDSVYFNGSLGATNPLAAITVSGDTEIQLGGNITTTNGVVTLNAPVTLNRNVTIATGSGGVVFGALAADAVDSDSSGTPRQLTVTGTGAITFKGEVGTTNPLAGMVISSSGAISVGGDVTTSGNSIVSFTGPVSLAADAVFTTNGANLTFSSTINSPTTARKLDVVTGKGTATFGAAIGATTALDDVTITAAKIILAGNVTTQDAIVTMTGAITLNNNVAIDTFFTATTGGAAITLSGSVNSISTGAKNLSFNAGTADVTVNSNVGSTKALAAFTVTSSDNTIINSVVKAATVSISAASLIDVAAAAKVTGTTSTTLIATSGGPSLGTPAEIKISGGFVGPAVTVTGHSSENTLLTSSNNGNFTATGTGLAGTEDNGSLTRLVKGVTSTFNFTNIGALDLTGGVSANTFAFTDWKGEATIDGGAGSDTLLVSRINETVANFAFGLTPLAVELSTGVDYVISPTGSVESATLTGGATNDSFDIGAWVLPVRINGGTGINDVAWAGAANVTLTANKFVAGPLSATLSGISAFAIEGTVASSTYTINGFRGDLTVDGVDGVAGAGTDILRVTSNSDFDLDVSSLVAGVLNISSFTNIDSVFLTGGASANTFNISNDFRGLLTLDGASGADVYNIDLPATGLNLVVTVADSGKSGKDTLTATPTGAVLSRTGTGTSGSIFRTTDSATPKKHRIDFTGIEIITPLT